MTIEVGGRTRIAAVFGDPVEHSLSPAMHNAAYATLGMDRAYAAFHVRPEQLASAIRAIPALNLLGVNLTVPHKERAVRMVTQLSAEAKMLGAINCVVNRRTGLYGDNTDARGLQIALASFQVDFKGATVIIVGAGGSAASAVLASIRIGARRIIIANRTPARASRLAKRFQPVAGARREVEARGLDALADRELLATAALVINATPLGLVSGRFVDLDYEATPEKCVFHDLVYGNYPTAFLKPAVELGRRCADGIEMLARQGELAFKLFNGVTPPNGVMLKALKSRLGR